MADMTRKYRQLPIRESTWKKLDRIRARSSTIRWQCAGRAAVLEEIIDRLPEDYAL